jgi:hypothetical protein
MNFIFGIVCLFVCVCAFSLRRESPDMILGDKPLIFEVVLSHAAGGWPRSATAFKTGRAAHWQWHAALGAGRQSGDGGWQQGSGVDRAMAGGSRGGGQAMVGGSKGGGRGSASGVGGDGAGHGRARPKERQRWIGRRGR